MCSSVDWPGWKSKTRCYCAKRAFLQPCRGKLTARPIETGETLNGGKILITENVREHWVMGQYEIVAVGDSARCISDDCERLHSHAWATTDKFHLIDARIKPGAWILAKPRTAIDSGTRDVFFLAIDDVIGIMA